ncbi:MAG: hypothetical protein J2P37_24825 [Ktedonobacteraceae bacterium]|nr:hypothetical protein [Ktedonobacteraceae bacterium]MBO0789474.1 hypothetical protein [Ktedonobacteraceae bacterium]
MIERYYIQYLSDGTLLVRERKYEQEITHPEEDRRIRLFHRSEDAHFYASAANRLQERLDGRYGHWVKHALPPGHPGIID